MPSYTFKSQFVPFIKEGTKTQTIRKIRKYPCKPGQMISHFTGPRFKPVRIIDKKECTDVHGILIGKTGKVVIFIDCHETNENYFYDYESKVLSKFLKDMLAWADGFRHPDDLEKMDGCFDLMFSWWKATHTLPFIGHLIKW